MKQGIKINYIKGYKKYIIKTIRVKIKIKKINEWQQNFFN
jgi:hypothetical protein